ncbi:uncharacterized protein DDB_G0271670 isoform X2 [Anopheles darlingi]|uniref:uncharacterized protein DDB_G0271670 isoform X2 n=1 Tax=Anopheles darlingi TaxID=43151 RepID=UPI0021004741|nr:uncharacterized protein DDB_G0271670 isoform X2 [Anopheles darlingi]
MGNGMNKVMPGLYIGNYRDSKDFQQLDRHGITHIVSIHDSPRRFHPVVRAGRSIANPNLGFQNQLQEFETNKLLEERKRLKERFPSLALESSDREQCYLSLDYYEELLESKGVCEGHCKFGKDCPTGICRQDSRGGAGTGGGGRANRKSSLASKKQYNTSLSTSPSSSSQLSVRSVGSAGGAQSCPTSPRCGKASAAQRRSTGEPGSGPAGSRMPDNPRAAGEYAAEIDIGELSELRRSSSIVSTYRPRSSPAGLYSYTGSAPPSIHGSRVDLSGGVSGGTGSAIYLGSSSGGGGGGGAGTGSSPGPCRRLSMRSTPKSTPESSPKASPKKSATTPGKMAASASPKKTAAASPNIGGRKGTSGASPSSSSSNASQPSPAAAAITTAQPAKKETNASGKATASKTTVPSNSNTAMTPGSTTTSTATSTTSTTTTTTTSTIAATKAKAATTPSSARRSEVPTTRTPSIVIDIGANRPDCVTASTGKAKKDMKDGFSTKDGQGAEGVANTNRNSETTVTRQTVTSNNASNRDARKE